MLLLSRGTKEMSEPMPSVAVADELTPEVDSNSTKDESAGKAWKKERVAAISVVLALCVLVTVLLLWHGVISTITSLVRKK